ncbi:hypothetical protein CEDDRAFT_02173 [Frankia sp. CeD]|nr:hypothetical protein BMG523Draft_02084 [Frankia sp. BMG5.23]KEZ36485.1 hypothetical protein CEDDRAFT_02173 [Frankia sp. CeD]
MSLMGLQHCHVLDLDRLWVSGGNELKMSHDSVVEERDQNVAEVEVGVELTGRVFGQLEQRAELASIALVLLNSWCRGHGSF